MGGVVAVGVHDEPILGIDEAWGGTEGEQREKDDGELTFFVPDAMAVSCLSGPAGEGGKRAGLSRREGEVEEMVQIGCSRLGRAVGGQARHGTMGRVSRQSTLDPQPT